MENNIIPIGVGLYQQMQDAAVNATTYKEFNIDALQDFIFKLSTQTPPKQEYSMLVSQDQMTMLTGTEEEKAKVKQQWFEREVRFRLSLAREYNIDYDLVFMICNKFSQQNSTRYTWSIATKSISTGEYDDSFMYTNLLVTSAGEFFLQEGKSDGYYEDHITAEMPITPEEVFNLLIVEDYKM